MPVRGPGDTTSFTGKGTPNPTKLWIPGMQELDRPVQAAFLRTQQWLNALVSTGFGSVSHTYAVSGTLVVPSGATGFLPPFYMPANQGVTCFNIRCAVRSGSCTVNAQHNGVTFSTIAVTTTPTDHPVSVVVANDDSFQPVITAVTAADGLSFSFYFSVTS